jgi:hypothetical protein
LYIFCGDHLLCARLRPADVDVSAGSARRLQRIVSQIRQTWPDVEITIRADSGFCREPIMAWCEAQWVDYVLGPAQNIRLKAMIAAEQKQARVEFVRTDQAARVFADFQDRTLETWSRERRVVAKAEHLAKGANPRFVVTSLRSDARVRKAAGVARWQRTETDSADAFSKAPGQWEFTVDAGKVNTLENGWRDLKIAVVQKRPAGAAASPTGWQSRVLPAASARVMWADLAPVKRFRRNWKTRIQRLGLKATADLHVLGDGASWIWKSANRALTGSHQTLDVYHACEHIADSGKALLGKETPAAAAFFERSRALLLEQFPIDCSD